MGARRDRITELGELQLEMLDVLKRLGEATVYDLMEGFPPERRPRSSTVQTVMRSLEKRGLATHRTEGRTFVFRVTDEAENVRGQAVRDVLQRMFGGSPNALVSTLLDVADFTPDELAELKRLLARRGMDGDVGGEDR